MDRDGLIDLTHLIELICSRSAPSITGKGPKISWTGATDRRKHRAGRHWSGVALSGRDRTQVLFWYLATGPLEHPSRSTDGMSGRSLFDSPEAAAPREWSILHRRTLQCATDFLPKIGN